jgi:hypothetical protein
VDQRQDLIDERKRLNTKLVEVGAGRLTLGLPRKSTSIWASGTVYSGTSLKSWFKANNTSKKYTTMYENL